MIQTTIFSHRPRVSLAWFLFCWWCPNRLLMTSQWPDNCEVITWIVISNSFDIDFIHGHIHGWSCKKKIHSVFAPLNTAWQLLTHRGLVAPSGALWLSVRCVMTSLIPMNQFSLYAFSYVQIQYPIFKFVGKNYLYYLCWLRTGLILAQIISFVWWHQAFTWMIIITIYIRVISQDNSHWTLSEVDFT